MDGEEEKRFGIIIVRITSPFFVLTDNNQTGSGGTRHPAACGHLVSLVREANHDTFWGELEKGLTGREVVREEAMRRMIETGTNLFLLSPVVAVLLVWDTI